MPDDLRFPATPQNLPASFFEGLVKDISVETWGELLKSNPTLKAAVLEGFNVPSSKVSRILRQPQIGARLQRLIRSDATVLNQILQLWAQEQLNTVVFLEMLDRDFLLDSWESLRNFIGPERFFAGLTILGYLDNAEFQDFVTEGFWERRIDRDITVPFIPFWDLWLGFVHQFPQAKNWLPQIGPADSQGPVDPSREGTQAQTRHMRAIEERCAKLQAKLTKAQEENSDLQQALDRSRKELEELRATMAEQARSRTEELQKALAAMRHEWFKRYQTVEEPALGKAMGHLESLFQRTEQAFALQQRADEEFGLVAGVRQKLLQVELYLKEIERIHAESLVVHHEVTRAKEALVQAKLKMLQLPGIEKALQPDLLSFTVTDLRQQIRFLDAIPENLPRVTELLTLVTQLGDLGFVSDPQAILEEVEHKKRQIMENLYAQYQMLQEQLPRGRHFESLDDLVKSRESKRYDLYVDGYNILLRLHGKNHPWHGHPLTAAREQFTAAVVRKSRLFRRIYLVYDGQEDFRDRQGSTEIVYTDKGRGSTADAYIIQAIQKGKDRLVLLSTGDQDIIRAVEERIYALVDPYHFYLFVYDMPFPNFDRSEV